MFFLITLDEIYIIGLNAAVAFSSSCEFHGYRTSFYRPLCIISKLRVLDYSVLFSRSIDLQLEIYSAFSWKMYVRNRLLYGKVTSLYFAIILHNTKFVSFWQRCSYGSLHFL